MTIGRIAIVTFVTVLLVGCGGVHHLERNAPGGAAIEEGPENIPTGSRVLPVDPGENVLEILAAPFYSIGDWVWTKGDSRLTHTFGLELSTDYFQLEESHSGSPVFFNFCARCRLYPATAYGGNIGIELLSWVDGEGGAKPRNLYAQALVSHRNLATLAGGWNIDTRKGRHGPRLSLIILEMMSVDISHRFGGELTASFGLRYTYGHAFVWSR